MAARYDFASDNVAYDWQWINYYCHQYLGRNPFGFSGRRIGDIICGLEKDLRFNWKKFRKTLHDHNPVNDAIGKALAVYDPALNVIAQGRLGGVNVEPLTRVLVINAGGAQLVYLVLFSYAFFFRGYTGLAITIGAIVTLFLAMQATGRIRWSQNGGAARDMIET